jgi:alpha-beta hydrolase superfamily lysophospholipase
MTHQMVTQIRAGSHTDCAGNAARRGASRVVLSGFSSGAAIVEGYATRHHDIDGIIPMSWSNQPQLSAAFQTLIGVLAPQLAAGKDYIEFFLDGADGYSEFCETFLFHAPGMRDDALEQLCGPDYYAQTAFPTPSGEAANGAALQATTIATVGNVGPTPVLLVFSDRDAAFPTADHRGADPDVVTAEIAMWQNGCNCEVSVYFQPNAGHVGLFHRTSKQVTNRILNWLDDHNL